MIVIKRRKEKEKPKTSLGNHLLVYQLRRSPCGAAGCAVCVRCRWHIWDSERSWFNLLIRVSDAREQRSRPVQSSPTETNISQTFFTQSRVNRARPRFKHVGYIFRRLLFYCLRDLVSFSSKIDDCTTLSQAREDTSAHRKSDKITSPRGALRQITFPQKQKKDCVFKRMEHCSNTRQFLTKWLNWWDFTLRQVICSSTLFEYNIFKALLGWNHHYVCMKSPGVHFGFTADALGTTPHSWSVRSPHR